MTNIKKVFADEVRRIARKEIKASVEPLLKRLASLKKQVSELSKRPVSAAPQSAKASVAAGGAETSDEAKNVRLTPKSIKKMREKMGISQKDFAKLIGTNLVSVGFWEKGKAVPRSKAKANMLQLRSMGKRDLEARFAELGIKPGSRRRPSVAKGVEKSAARARKRAQG